MNLLTIGSLVLCLILKPQDPNATQETKQDIQKVPGIIKHVFTKKVLKDTPDRVAVFADKDMITIETLDGEAEITIGADACKRVVEPKEYEAYLKRKQDISPKEELKENPKKEKLEKDQDKNEESSIEKVGQSDEEKAKLLKELEN